MVSFSNMDGAHCDSVVDHYTLPSNSIQMDVKFLFNHQILTLCRRGP